MSNEITNKKKEELSFKSKKIIVTGANRSIGRNIALDFAKQGADVVISYRSDKEGALETLDLIKSYSSKSTALYADFLDNANVEKFAVEAIGALGGIDILINNAGMLARETLFELSPEKMQQVFQVNTIAPLYLTKLCSENMIKNSTKGCIINISSIAGSSTMPKGIGYASSKAALNKWTQNAALNLAQYGVRVNAVLPGVIEAGMNQSTSTSDPELWKNYMHQIPLQRAGTPQDIANMVLFLASDKAQWITGKNFEVDGGHALS